MLFLVTMNKSIANVIRSRYNDEIVKQIPRFEKLDFKIRKNEADLDFLQFCQKNDLILTFLNFKVAISSLRFSRTYKQCERQFYHFQTKERIQCSQEAY